MRTWIIDNNDIENLRCPECPNNMIQKADLIQIFSEV